MPWRCGAGWSGRGAIFRTSADSEVVLHLIARSAQREIPDAILDGLSQVKGAYSLVFLTPDGLYAVRDPNGFRPLVLGEFEGHPVVASETLRLRPHRGHLPPRDRAGGCCSALGTTA